MMAANPSARRVARMRRERRIWVAFIVSLGLVRCTNGQRPAATTINTVSGSPTASSSSSNLRAARPQADISTTSPTTAPPSTDPRAARPQAVTSTTSPTTAPPSTDPRKPILWSPDESISMCSNVRLWTGSDGYGCQDWVESSWCSIDGLAGSAWDSSWGSPENYGVNGVDPLQACCGCGGGCTDTSDWHDDNGYGCDDWVKSEWCSPDGSEGIAWESSWGSITDYAVNGILPSDACCGCGGGMSILHPVSTTMAPTARPVTQPLKTSFPTHGSTQPPSTVLVVTSVPETPSTIPPKTVSPVSTTVVITSIEETGSPSSAPSSSPCMAKVINSDKVMPCVFPFTHNSTIYNSCIQNDQPGDVGVWCATSVSSGKIASWGHCIASGTSCSVVLTSTETPRVEIPDASVGGDSDTTKSNILLAPLITVSILIVVLIIIFMMREKQHTAQKIVRQNECSESDGTMSQKPDFYEEALENALEAQMSWTGGKSDKSSSIGITPEAAYAAIYPPALAASQSNLS